MQLWDNYLKFMSRLRVKIVFLVLFFSNFFKSLQLTQAILQLLNQIKPTLY